MVTNKLQDTVFERISAVPEIRSGFYFSGGTALAECYLKHRVSVDIDLFSDSPFGRDLADKVADAIVAGGGVVVDRASKIHDRYTFNVSGYGFSAIVDIVYYPFKRLENSGKTYQGLPVDSVRDIWTNKWATVFDRNEPKDVLDIACLYSFGRFNWGIGLEQASGDLRSKFGLGVSPATMVQQFRSRIKSSGAEHMRSILYRDPGKLDVFAEDFPLSQF